MAFQVSPGVSVREVDLTNVVPAVSTSVGGYAGNFTWGPVEEIKDVSSEKQLVDTFGVPTNTNAVDFFTAASFLKYSNGLRTVRMNNSAYKNAVDAGSAVLVKNEAHFEQLASGLESGTAAFVAKYPGRLGNSLSVTWCTADSSGATTEFQAWTPAVRDLFESAPGTSQYAYGVGGEFDELHVAIIDKDGLWTGLAGTVLEKFAYVSQASDAKNADGSSNYWRDVINAQSKYIWVAKAPSEMTTEGNTATGRTFVTTDNQQDHELTGGVDAVTSTPGEYKSGFDMFADSDTIDVNLLFTPSLPQTETDAVDVANYVLGIAAARGDCFALVSPMTSATVGSASPKDDVISFASQLTGTSYGACDSSAVKMYDKYNDKYIWIPTSGHVAGLCAQTDGQADPWFSPAGLNRGQLLSVTRLAYNPSKLDRDDLYKSRVNPIVAFPGEGTVLFGDRTLLVRPSAFDRINVRRLFIVLEKAISVAARAQLFEFNDEFTRAMFKNMVEPFLRDIKGRRGITDFKVVCDDTNNTSEIIDSNQFVADMYIKPNRSINFISLNFIATRSGVQFNEIGG